MGGHRFQCCVAFFLPPCHFGYRLPELLYSFATVCKQILLKSFKKQPRSSSCGAPSFLLYFIKSHLIMLNSIVSLSLSGHVTFSAQKETVKIYAEESDDFCWKELGSEQVGWNDFARLLVAIGATEGKSTCSQPVVTPEANFVLIFTYSMSCRVDVASCVVQYNTNNVNGCNRSHLCFQTAVRHGEYQFD